MPHRKLSVIMFSDIASYSAVMGKDEQAAMELLEKSKSLQVPIIIKNNGTWQKEMGDGAFSIFYSVTEALDSAIEIQKAVRADPDLALRISIHMGEVTFKDDDIFGDSVNLTARLDQISISGAVLFTEKVYQEIKNKSSYNSEPLGPFEFKNIDGPVEVYALANDGLVIPENQTLVERAALEGDEAKRVSSDEHFINEVKKYIEEHIDDPQLSVENLAKKIGYSRPQLYRKVTALTKMAPSDFVREIRLRKAAQLFEHNTGNISEVAFKVGFNNLSYFSKCFQERFGVLPSEFSKSWAAAAGIPASLTSFVGRHTEIKDVQLLLERNRLVTLTGTGGTGKTRLALEAVRTLSAKFIDGIYEVKLAPVANPNLVASTIAKTLGVAENPIREVKESIALHLKQKRVLLLLDNFEHVMESVGVVTYLLEKCSSLKVLVSSRTLLNVQGEQDYNVGSLEIPENIEADLTQLRNNQSVDLFGQRAQAVDPKFELREENIRDVALICTQLDGLPLAIELAAARIKLFSPGSILHRLTSHLDFLKSSLKDRPQRHQTLRQAIGWSYDLLNPEEQTLFRRLSVFASGFSIESAESICLYGYADLEIIEGIELLVDHSLVTRVMRHSEEPRFSILETVKSFGKEKLSKSGELDATMTRFCVFYQQLAERAEPHLTQHEQKHWLSVLDLELDNLRLALEWMESKGESEMGLRLASSLWRFWNIRTMMKEGSWWLEKMLNFPTQESGDALRSKALGAYGVLIGELSQPQRATKIFTEGVKLARKLNDEKELATALNHLGFMALRRGEYHDGTRYSEEALNLNRKHNTTRGIAVSLNNLAWIAIYQGWPAKAYELFQECIDINELNGDARGLGYALSNQARADLFLGNSQVGLEKINRAYDILEGINDLQLMAWALILKIKHKTHFMDLEENFELLETCMEMWDRVGNLWGLFETKITKGINLLYDGQLDAAQKCLKEAASGLHDLNDANRSSVASYMLGRVEEESGNDERARVIYLEALISFQSRQELISMAAAMEGLASVLSKDKDQTEKAITLMANAESIRLNCLAPQLPDQRKYVDPVLFDLKLQTEAKKFKSLWLAGSNYTDEECIDLVTESM